MIELQLRLVEGERERKAAEDQWNLQKHAYEEVQIVFIMESESGTSFSMSKIHARPEQQSYCHVHVLHVYMNYISGGSVSHINVIGQTH